MYGHVTEDPHSYGEEKIIPHHGRWSDLLLELDIPSPKTHGLSMGTVAAVNFNIGIRTRVQTLQPDEKLLDVAFKMLTSTLIDYSHEAPTYLGDVYITPQGASGIGFECCSNKATAVLNHYEEIHDYTLNYRKYPQPLFRYNHKEREILPAKKILSDTTRAIIFPPTQFYMLQKMHTQKLDTALKLGFHPWFAYGCSPTRGFLNELANRFAKYKYVFKGDATKFDSTIRAFAFKWICKVRKTLSPHSSHDALDYIYEVLSHKHVVLPTGEMIVDECQPSGQACTTSDNSIWHALIFYYCACKRLREMGKALTLENVDSLATVSLYSDDHVAATNDERFASYQFRKDCYAELGAMLKEEDDLVAPVEEIHRLVFLGGRFVPLGDPYPFVYGFDEKEAIPCLHLGLDKKNPDEAVQTLASYAELLAYDKNRFEKIRSIHARIVQEHMRGRPVPHLPGREYYLGLQQGFESVLSQARVGDLPRETQSPVALVNGSCSRDRLHRGA